MTAPDRDGSTLVARDIMVTKLITLRPEMDVQEAIDLLLAHKISGAPVVDPEHKLVGVLSERCCIAQLVHSLQDHLPSMHVSDAMQTDLTTIQEDTPLLTIVHHFTTHRLRRLPVLREGRLVGQISRRDVLKAMARTLHNQRSFHAHALYLSAVRDGQEFEL